MAARLYWWLGWSASTFLDADLTERIGTDTAFGGNSLNSGEQLSPQKRREQL
jgi:hypothetical protein